VNKEIVAAEIEFKISDATALKYFHADLLKLEIPHPKSSARSPKGGRKPEARVSAASPSNSLYGGFGHEN